MKIAVLDIQGFSIPDFHAKELAIYDGKNMKSYVFKPIIPFKSLQEDYQRQIKYLVGNHHGIYYNYGESNYSEIHNIVCTDLWDVDMVYLKGHVKEDFIKKIFLEAKLNPPYIINLEYTCGNVPKFEKSSNNCAYHSLTICSCSIKNAYVLYNYIDSLLPK